MTLGFVLLAFGVGGIIGMSVMGYDWRRIAA